MHHILFDTNTSNQFKAAFLMKREALQVNPMQSAYIDPLSKVLSRADCIGVSLAYNSSGKAPITLIREYLNELVPKLSDLGIEILYVTDSAYFKELAGLKNVKHEYGYVHNCALPSYEHIKVVFGVSYQALYYNPLLQEKLDYSVQAIIAYYQNTSLFPDFIKTAYYPTTDEQIIQKLKELLKSAKILAIDIEAYSLRFYESGIATITFCWNKHEGMAFTVDLAEYDTPVDGKFHRLIPNLRRRNILKQFFLMYRGEPVYHNACYDVKVLVFWLFMEGRFNAYEEMIHGIQVLTRNMQDTKLIYYLCTNNTVKNELSLKAAAFEFAGNYGINVTDISVHPKDKILNYNLIDGLSTFFIYEKWYPILQAEQQARPYYSVFLPSVRVIIQMELVGMPLDINRVREVNAELNTIRNNILADMFQLNSVLSFQETLRYEEYVSCNEAWKKKSEPLSYFDYVVFNPNSNPQLQRLIYQQLGYAVIDKTDSGQPSTGNDTLKKLIHVSKCPEDKLLFEKLIALADVSIILDNFLNAFLNKSIQHEDGWWWLHGNFNLGGTVSGRLSSSEPKIWAS